MSACAALVLGLALSAPAMPAAARALQPVSFESLAGWHEDALADAFAAFHRSCREILDSGRGFAGRPRMGGAKADWLATCRQALALPEAVSDRKARAFFEANFTPLAVTGKDGREGLFTGYFEPEMAGSRTPGGPYRVPLYARPADLKTFGKATAKRLGVPYGRIVNGKPVAYHTRAEIERGALRGRGLELVWLTSPEDAFFLHIQGSGRIRLPDGSVMRVGFAAKNGRPYTPIGRFLVQSGEIPRDEISMQSIRAWLDAHPDRAQDLMWKNQSFIFFREVKGVRPDLGPVGAENVPLTPGRSLAVDRGLYAYGTPVWLETGVPAGRDGALVPMRRLMIAQDTGTAIKGAVRGDVFWGSGERAGEIAGLMQSRGRMTVLLPKALAARLAR